MGLALPNLDLNPNPNPNPNQDDLLRWSQAHAVLLQIFGPREQVQRLQAAPGNAYHFAKLAHYAAAVTEQGLEDEAYFAPLADMEALPLALTLTHLLTLTHPLTLTQP